MTTKTTRPRAFSPTARVPDWVVLARIREYILTGRHVPPEVYAPDALADYVPALLAAGHTESEIYRRDR